MKKIKGTVIIYLGSKCSICQVIKENKEKISELLLNFFTNVSYRITEDNLEFVAYGFEAVPVVIFPGYRPFESINPRFLLSEDSIRQMIDGTLLPEDVLHYKANDRIRQGITFNKNLEYFL